jgi:hypothetical protein
MRMFLLAILIGAFFVVMYLVLESCLFSVLDCYLFALSLFVS